MAVAPEHSRSARPVLPWLPLPAIVAFSVLGVGGSVLLTYTTYSFAEAKRAEMPLNRKVYEARAVPFDALENPAQRAAAITRALAATQTEMRRANSDEHEQRPEISQTLLVANSDRELHDFPAFDHLRGSNTYLAISGTSFGISGSGAPSGFAAPDAEVATAAPVPEASTWVCGAALFLLIAARGLRARLHRQRRRH